METKNEIWKQIEDSIYYVSNLGNVQSRKDGKTRDLKTSTNGRYMCFVMHGKTTKIHRRVALEFIDNPLNLPVVDHINRNPLDNRAENLRWVTSAENNQNRTKNVGASSQYYGVTARKHGNWQARITTDGKLRTIGTYKLETDAARAYDRKALEYYGQFAKLNFPLDYIITQNHCESSSRRDLKHGD